MRTLIYASATRCPGREKKIPGWAALEKYGNIGLLLGLFNIYVRVCASSPDPDLSPGINGDVNRLVTPLVFNVMLVRR